MLAHEEYQKMKEGEEEETWHKCTQLLREGIKDENTLIIRKRLLRFWPDRPTELEIKIAQKKIE